MKFESMTSAPARTAFGIAPAGLLALMLAAPSSNAWAASPFTEADGRVHFGVEEAPPAAGWTKATAIPGYLGSAYYASTVTTEAGGKGTLTFSIEIRNAGNYQILVRNRITGSNTTENNDSFLSASGTPVPGGFAIGSNQWTKIYTNQANAWSWHTSTKDHDPQPIRQRFTAGTHTIRLSLRSAGHIVDHVLVYDYAKYPQWSAATGKGTLDDQLDALAKGTVIAPADPMGRIAVVADGNYRDSDDIAGTPVSLAILRAKGLQDRLVHYSHSCDLKPGANDPGGEFREREMQTSCDGTAARWGGFGSLKFQNAIKQRDAVSTHLAEQIDKSTEADPLWIIEAGEPDIMWMAVNKSQAAKRKFVHIVTHHPANDAGDSHDLSDVMGLGIPQANLHRIPDQNTLLKKPLSQWHWARDHQDGRIKWLWERGNLAQTAAMDYPGIVGDFDPSDAGMIWYWATLDKGGDEACDIPKLRALLTAHVATTLIAPRAPGQDPRFRAYAGAAPFKVIAPENGNVFDLRGKRLMVSPVLRD